MQYVKISTETNQVSLKLSCDILSRAPSANAIACTVMAVPVFVPHDIIYILFIVCPQTKSAELALTLIAY